MDDSQLTNSDVRELIVGLRGGIPSRCDFCNEPTEPNKLEPEEAGAWACWDCMDRWNATDKVIKEYPVRVVSCPTCNAQVGEPCRRSGGRMMGRLPHAPRHWLWLKGKNGTSGS